MLLYKDVITDKELCTDAFKVEETDYFYIIHGKNIKETGDIDEALIGGNKSEEAEEEGTESCHTIVPNITGSCNLEEVCTITKAQSAKKQTLGYLAKLKKMDAGEYNEKKQSCKVGDKKDYAADRDAMFKALARSLSADEVAVEVARGNVFAKKPASKFLDVLLFDHFCGKETFMAKRWYTAKDDEFDLEGQVMPLVQDGEEDGACCSLILWKHACYEEGC